MRFFILVRSLLSCILVLTILLISLMSFSGTYLADQSFLRSYASPIIASLFFILDSAISCIFNGFASLNAKPRDSMKSKSGS